ncbi:lipid-A-disaccharide synthase [Pelagicoccus sp. SDUM812002]|uniref:lipid-A-disaccharide synthase n=1 Tax=Pelagicoccus sp. SDUM812002 TaxID=3041266 RepID=UPI00280F20C3|nr:lipid-A-disaccharide synthase [Pelagicoccus sp. SDUM812002]MDQ8185204.1 lipid-A-disaccharide synthase [Pelagicoccus sp. SDUM812002]
MTAALDFSFPRPTDSPVDVLVIAGEHSGDEHAARMIKAAREKNGDLKVCAVGGRHLQAAGAQLLFDLTQYSVVGFVEVLKNYRELKRLFDEIVGWIKEHRPKAVVFVDYPGMNLRIAKRLSEEGISSRSGGATRLLYYISPQVWAWKEKRKFEMAKILDSLAVIFPFEVDVFEGTQLETRFVGHPFLSSDYDLPVNYDPSGPILLLPGSRRAAIGRIAPVLFSAFSECLKSKSKLKAVCIYASEDLKELLQSILGKFPDVAERIELRPNTDSLGARAVLTSSGTMSLNCALANIPGAVAYRTHPLTYVMGRMLVKIPYIGIANVLLDKPLYPEYIQGAATRKRLAAEISDCIENVDRIKQTRNWAAELRELLDKPSSGGVADWLLEYVDK